MTKTQIEKLLKEVVQIGNSITDVAERDYYMTMKKNGEEFALGNSYCICPVAAHCLAVEQFLEKELRNSKVSKTTLNSTKAAEKILEQNRKKTPYNSEYHYAYIDEKTNRQIFADGVTGAMAFSLKDHLEFYPKAPTDWDAGKLLQVETRMPYDGGTLIPTPSLAQIKQDFTIAKAKKIKTDSKEKAGDNIFYDFGNGGPVVNAEMLITMLTILGEKAQLYIMGEKKPLTFINGENYGWLMPIYVTENFYKSNSLKSGNICYHGIA